MTEIRFRNLTAEDVECRVCNSTDKNINLLIYKNARVDMAILNDTVGLGWKREHNFKDGKNYCTVSIWDKDNAMWVSREDCGTESNTEAEKGQSSDAFKRACFNFGIGTELYTGPKISIPKTDKDEWNNKVTMTFSVKELEVSDSKKITHLTIVDKYGNVRFNWSEGETVNTAPSNNVIKGTTKSNNYPTYDYSEEWKEYCSNKVSKEGFDRDKALDIYNRGLSSAKAWKYKDFYASSHFKNMAKAS